MFVTAKLVHVESSAVFKQEYVNGEIVSDDLFDKLQYLSRKLVDSSSSKQNGIVTMDLMINYESHKYMILPSDLPEVYTWSEASIAASKVEAYGYTDWRLPTKYELEALYRNKNQIGGFVTKCYWSSSEFDIQRAFDLGFRSGTSYKSQKSSTNKVRCIRMCK